MRHFDGNRGRPLVVPWDEDKRFRMNPAAVTQLLREQVPVLGYVGWSVKSIEPGKATSVLPLNAPSTNQHFSHQAALFVLAADYTGGTALASLLSGWPVVGVHPVTSQQSASLWLLKVEIKYLQPSVGDLIVRAAIDEEQQPRIQRRFLQGKAVVESMPVRFYNGDVLIAEATATFYARQTESLRTDGVDADRINALFKLKLTSSAELIAGVRAQQNGRLFDDPYAAEMAGPHGRALAARFCERSPQLGGMVAARTRHADDSVRRFVAGGGRQIINVGVGWDMRAFRLELPPGTRIFELDFPTTLRERERRLVEAGISNRPGVERVQTPIDVRTMPLAETMKDVLAMDQPVLLIWEGMSMYFEEHEVRDVLRGMLPALSHPDSMLWMDLVDREPLVHPERFSDSVQQFLRGMQILGEPFTFGSDTADDFLASAGLSSLEVVTSDAYFPDVNDSVYSIYQFCLAQHGIHQGASAPATFQPTRIDPAATERPKPHAPMDDALLSPSEDPATLHHGDGQ